MGLPGKAFWEKNFTLKTSFLYLKNQLPQYSYFILGHPVGENELGGASGTFYLFPKNSAKPTVSEAHSPVRHRLAGRSRLALRYAHLYEYGRVWSANTTANAAPRRLCWQPQLARGFSDSLVKSDSLRPSSEFEAPLKHNCQTGRSRVYIEWKTAELPRNLATLHRKSGLKVLSSCILLLLASTFKIHLYIRLSIRITSSLKFVASFGPFSPVLLGHDCTSNRHCDAFLKLAEWLGFPCLISAVFTENSGNLSRTTSIRL